MSRFRPFFVSAFAALAACTSESTGTIQISLGGEADALTRAPAPTTLVIESIGTDGAVSQLSRTKLPASTIDLPALDPSTVGALRITGIDDANVTRVLGNTLPFQFGALNGSSLEIFVQRVGEFARLPSPFSVSFSLPVTTAVVGRYLFTASGTASQVYDLLALSALTNPPTLPRAPLSVAASSTKVLLIDASGATWFDLSDSSSTEMSPPPGGTFAEIAGGATVIGDDGSAYVVGATRSSTPSSRVLVLKADGTFAFASLATERMSASATWVAGRGLAVTGGSTNGAGVEILAPGSSIAAPLAYPADATRGAGALPVDATHLLLVGGGAGIRIVDLACAAACAATPWSADLPFDLANVDFIPLAGRTNEWMALGTDANGASRAVQLVAGTTREVPLRVPRAGARLMPLPTGGVVVVGGATDLESFVP